MSNKVDLMASLVGSGREDVVANGGIDAKTGPATDNLFGDEDANNQDPAPSKNLFGGDDNDNLFSDDPPPLALDFSPPVNEPPPPHVDEGGSLFLSSQQPPIDSVAPPTDSSLLSAPPHIAPPSVPPPVPPPAVESDPTILTPEQPIVAPSAPTEIPAPVPQQQHHSTLAESGLLGFASAVSNNPGSGGGGGLFDDIDEQEAEKEAAAAAEQERKRIAEEEQERHRQQQLLEEQERKRKEQEQQQLLYQQQQQQLQDQMQSIHLHNSPNMGGYSTAGGYVQTQSTQQTTYPPPQQQQQYPPQQQNPPPEDPPVTLVATGFYRDREPPTPQTPAAYTAPTPANTPYGGIAGAPYQLNNHGHQQPQTTPPRYYQPQQPGNYTAGLNHPDMSLQHQRGPMTPLSLPTPLPTPLPPQQPPIDNLFGKVIVSDPILIQSSASMFGLRQPPHWSYQIATEIKSNATLHVQAGIWLVRRRFRHVVALEDRLREDCPGAILPPSPEKHATRALEEATASQSVEFAMQRATELQVYLNELVQHPICYKSPVLRLFLALQDDLGTAWAECSGNALTRLANAGVGAAMKVSETSTGKLPWQSDGGPGDYGAGGGEDNAELLALQSAESVRMGLVQQAVPKLEGAVTLLREHAEQAGATGMELSRLVKEMHVSDIELAQPVEIVAAGMLRSGRRSKRLAVELAAAVHSFQQHYKYCRYEKHSFQDRKHALQRRHKERMKADQRAAQLIMHQRTAYGYPPQPNNPYISHNPYGPQQNHDRLAQEASIADLYANDVHQEAEEIGQRLLSEVHRIAYLRRQEWASSLKIIASSMKEAATERIAVWEMVQQHFLTAFPDYQDQTVAAEQASTLSAENSTTIVPPSAGVGSLGPNELVTPLST